MRTTFWRHERAVSSSVYALIAGLFCAPLFEQPLGLGGGDWDQHTFYYASVLKSLLEYGALPLWNPWYCGGAGLWQNPQVPLLSLVYPLSLLVPLALAVKLNILLHVWIGLAGMHLLLRRGLRFRFVPGIIYLAIVFACSGALALHLAVGHASMLPAFYLPLLLFFVFRAMEGHRLRHVVLASLMLALMLWNGGTHILPLAVVTLAMLLLTQALRERAFRPVVIGVLVFGLGCAIAAPRLVPIAMFTMDERFADTRVSFGRVDWMSREMLVRAYTDPRQTLADRLTGQQEGWWEYGNYVGDFAVALFAAALIWVVVTRWRTRHDLAVPVAITAVLLVIVAAGEFSPFAPASILRRLPFFSSFRIPSRYTMAVVLMGAATIAAASREFDGAAARRWRVLAGILCTATSIQIVWTNSKLMRGIFVQPPLERTFRPLQGALMISTDGEANAFGPNSPMLRALMQDSNFYNCYEPLQFTRTAQREPPLVFADRFARVGITRFSPNRVEAMVSTGSVRGRVYMNQNYAPGWSSNVGPVMLDHERGQMAVDAPPGFSGSLVFSYSPPGIMSGWFTFAVALAAIVGARSWSHRAGG
jgi:hypothetical protein